MPTVRMAGGRQVATTALGGVRKSAAETPISTGAGVAAAQQDTARELGRLGGTLTAIGTERIDEAHTREVARQDDVVYLAGSRKLADLDHEMLTAETGAFHTVKGKDALGLTEKALEKFDATASEILAGMTPRQQARFQREIEGRRASMVRATDGYASDQMDAYETGETKAALASSTRNAILATTVDPLKIGEELARTDGIITTFVAHKGLGPEVRAEMVLRTHTEIHAGVIDELLAKGKDDVAAAWLKKYGDAMDPDVRQKIADKIDVATTAGAGLRASNEIWTALGPKPTDDDAAISLDRMETTARERFADDPKKLAAAIHYLRERKAGVDAGRAERKAATGATLWTAVANGTPLAAIQRMPEYLGAPGPLQIQITDRVVSQAEHRADRAYTIGQRAEAATEKAQRTKGWAQYWDLSRPETLATLSEPEILAKTGDLGQERVNDLMTRKRALGKSDDTVRAAAIDADQFNTIATSAGYTPYKSGLSSDAKAELGELKNAVETAIDQEQGRVKRLLSRDEKDKVMHGIVDRKVMLDRWFTDPEKAAVSVVNAADRAAAYVPIAKIPEQSLTEWVAAIRVQDPAMQHFTREQILAQWRPRIEKAHAAAVLKLGLEEETRRLLGR